MKRSVFVTIFVILISSLNAQQSTCNDFTKYIPNDLTPRLNVKINYHFFRKNDGTGIYQPVVDSSSIEQMTTWVNNIYRNLEPPTIPATIPTDTLYDSKISFIVKGIYYHDNSDFYEGYKRNCSSVFYNGYGINKTSEINIFFATDSGYSIGVGCGAPNHITMLNCNISSYATAQLLAHELGHSLGLDHPWYQQFDDTFYPDNNTEWLPCNNSTISNNIMGYNTCRRYFSPKQIGYMHFLLLKDKNRFKYVDCIINPTNDSIVISSNKTIDYSALFDKNIIIRPNVVLTITCTCFFNPNTKIIVQPGGKLVIDGGTLTSACEDQMWQGIEVWGTRSRSQYPNYNPAQPEEEIGKQWQGWLELKDATIENAICAVTLWKQPYGITTTGGILTANNTTFRNNAKSIRAPQLYRNFNPHNPSSEMPYRGSIRNCSFIINSDYLDGGATFNEHVSLTSVNGFSFVACDFSVDSTVANVSEWSCGIASASAGFSVSGSCIVGDPNQVTVPCTNYKYSTFEGFRYGIYVGKGLANNNTIGVFRTEFTNNVYGIYASNIANATITNSLFKVGKGYVEGCSVSTGFGLYLENSSSYTVRDNEFDRDTLSTGDYYGIAIKMQTPTAEEIYRNSFSNLTYANYVEGNLQSSSRLGASTLGVLYQCNSNEDNYADFFSPAGSSRSFRPSQGTATLAAGNTFSQNATWHIYNGSNTLMNYYYAPGQAPDPDKTYYVSIHSAPLNNCVLGGGGGAADESINRDSLTSVYDDALANYNNVNTLYENLKDGGSTAQLQIEIQTANTDDMWQLQQELLDLSPYLSDTILLEIANNSS
ncbi:MAG: hypothetical protein LBM67_06520, partial [Lentimicrobiaceae bacterium]|nr:hypothetical protein [Lentimicrobiaceae bacterium]